MAQAVVASPSLARPRFNSRAVCVRFELDEVTLEQAFLLVLHFSVNIILAMPHAHLCPTWCNLNS